MKENLASYIKELKQRVELLSCEVTERQAKLTSLQLIIIELENILKEK
jgi:hypothetical protein